MPVHTKLENAQKALSPAHRDCRCTRTARTARRLCRARDWGWWVPGLR